MKKKSGAEILPEDYDFPKAAEGEQGVNLIEKCVESFENDSAWVDMDNETYS